MRLPLGLTPLPSGLSPYKKNLEPTHMSTCPDETVWLTVFNSPIFFGNYSSSGHTTLEEAPLAIAATVPKLITRDLDVCVYCVSV